MTLNGNYNQNVESINNQLEPFRFNSFFAGIGGFDLGFERAGFSPAFQCEINDFCKSVLNRHWPNLLYSTDIKKIDISTLPDTKVWCGGFPCQDVSVARGWLGRDGLKGKNSGLFYPFLELIKQKLPQVVLLENVTGLLSSHTGQDFATIISSFTNLGYGVAWRIVNARYFGAPQSRPRIFVCAWKGRADLALDSLYEKKGGGIVKNARKGFITPTMCKITGASVPLVGYCLAATSGRHTGTDWSRTYVSYFDKVRRLTPAECEGLQGFPINWSLPEKNYSLYDDEIDTLRYHAIGNAVCVPVIEWFAERISKGLSRELGDMQQIGLNIPLLPKELFETFIDFNKSIVSHKNTIHKNARIRWASGGAAFDDWFFTESVSPAPNIPIEKKLIDVIEKREVEGKYYLSPNASKGILRRVSSQGRTLFGPLEDALRRLSTHYDDIESSTAVYCRKIG